MPTFSPNLLLCFSLTVAYCTADIQVATGDAISSGIPVRIIRENDYKFLSVSSEGAIYSNGTNSDSETCWLILPTEVGGRIELESSQYHNMFIGVTEDGSVKSASKRDLYSFTLEITSFSKTLLKVVVADRECALGFTDEGVARNACFTDISKARPDHMGSGSGEESGRDTAFFAAQPDLFTFIEDFVCI